jgi:hypothetical protein
MNKLIIGIVIVALLVNIGLVIYVFKSKKAKDEEISKNIPSQKEVTSSVGKKTNYLQLIPINLGEVVVPMPVHKEDEDITIRIKIYVYIEEQKHLESKVFEEKFKPKLREIVAKAVKAKPYLKLRNIPAEQEILKLELIDSMNKEIGMDIVKEVVIDSLTFE